MQQVDELTLTYIQIILQQACLRSLALLMFENGKLLGYMKAYTSEFRRLTHVLTDGTVMMKPTAIGKGYVCKLYQAFYDEVQNSMRHIRLIEIVVHSSNIHSIRLNKKMVLFLNLFYQTRFVMKMAHSIMRLLCNEPELG
jgi:L-amino acid N-acyltransferase YncA